MSRSVTPLLALGRFLAGEDDPAACALLRRGIKKYLTHKGTLPLERCLALPTTAHALALGLRDVWLREAACVHGGRPWEVARAAERQRWKIHRWVQDGKHSAKDNFERALYAAACHAPLPAARQLSRILTTVADSANHDTAPALG